MSESRKNEEIALALLRHINLFYSGNIRRFCRAFLNDAKAVSLARFTTIKYADIKKFIEEVLHF